jgi:hypothetical protein
LTIRKDCLPKKNSYYSDFKLLLVLFNAKQNKNKFNMTNFVIRNLFFKYSSYPEYKITY